MSTYVFDQAWQKERDRLDRAGGALSTARPAGCWTVSGSRPDGGAWRSAAGAGGIALWLADRVGETGHVLATDLDTRFLDGHGRPNLEVRTHNIVTDPLDEAAFDVIHARAVVEHVADRELVIKRLVAALRPGGWLLIEDVDFGGATAGMLAQYVSAPEPERPAMERIYLRRGKRVLRHRRRSVLRQAAGRRAERCRARPRRRRAACAGGVRRQRAVDAGQHRAARRADRRHRRSDRRGRRRGSLPPAKRPDFCYLPPLMVSAWGQRDLHGS